MRRALPIVLTAAVIGGIAGAAVGIAFDGGSTAAASGATVTPTAATASSAGLSSEQIYRSAAPGVVVITDTQTQQIPPTAFTPPQTQHFTALGSGFVIDGRGDIVTNDHVVQGSSGIRVGFSSGATYPATVVGTDPSTDIAVVRVQAPRKALHPLPFADSSGVQVGDPVYAIGNPFGLDRTMTAGIVSAVGRDIQSPNGLAIPNVIQTDAAINHGNSGGPLLDTLGRVVGINSQIQGGTVDANVGVGFAVSSNAAKSVADELIADGHVEHAFLGVAVDPIDPSLAGKVPGLPSSALVVAQVLRGSPAAKAGLVPSRRQVTVDGESALVGGDVIVAIDGKPVSQVAQLAEAVAAKKPGDTMTLQVARNGTRRDVTVTLGNAPGTR